MELVNYLFENVSKLNWKSFQARPVKEEEEDDNNTFSSVIGDIFTVTVPVFSQDSPCGFCGRQSGTGRGCSPSTAVLFCQDHSMDARYLFAYHRRHLNSVTDSVVE
jgi:hypothetical protein